MVRTTAFPLFALALLAAPAAAEPASPWIGDGQSKLRLVDAGRAPSGERLAAIAITLEPGWKTYWRQPGASGMPPRFDFSRSVNLAEVKVAYPVPERSEDDDGVTNVYHGSVILPVTVKPRDPNAPVELELVADYGICDAVCVPTRAAAELDLEPSGGVDGPAAEEARKAAALTPKPQGLGAQGALTVAEVRRAKAASGSAVEIAVSTPEGSGEPRLFAETGDGDFAPSPELVDAAGEGRSTFRIEFEEPELPQSGLRLTLAAGGKAIETPIALDAIGTEP